jgi:ankyrin repeat protein
MKATTKTTVLLTNIIFYLAGMEESNLKRYTLHAHSIKAFSGNPRVAFAYVAMGRKIFKWAVEDVIYHNNIPVLRVLVEKGSYPINIPLPAELSADFPSVNLMHYAAMANKVDIIRYLLEKKADPNVRARSLDGYDGSTPLHFAAANGNLEAITVLVKEANAKIYLKNKLGKSPRMMAELFNEKAAAKLIHEYRAQIVLPERSPSPVDPVELSFQEIYKPISTQSLSSAWRRTTIDLK